MHRSRWQKAQQQQQRDFRIISRARARVNRSNALSGIFIYKQYVRPEEAEFDKTWDASNASQKAPQSAPQWVTLLILGDKDL